MILRPSLPSLRPSPRGTPPRWVRCRWCSSSSPSSRLLVQTLSCSSGSLIVVVLLAYRPVGEVEDARGKGLRVHEFQGLCFRLLVEEAFAAAHEDRVDHELELVEEPVSQQRPDEGRAAGDHDVLAWLVLELLDLLRDVVL